MSQKRLTTWQKATALVPLALLSGAWTTSLTVTGSATAAQDGRPRLPDGSTVPDSAIKAPASVSLPGQIAPGVPAGSAQGVIAGASTNGIPAAALAAYQRAAQVIDQADPSCHLQWPLIAAIGRVESNHGRYDGNTLTQKGISEPGIYGIPLDGSNGTAKISDTDAGQFDNDPVYDRAVGPMQFIPSTWSVVGVDGDGDGRRNPQDINDASLATAVYLCSGNENLSTPAGQRSSVYRYNHSASYVDLVLSIMRAYAQGDYAAVPTSSAAPTTFSSYYGDSVVSPGTRGAKAHHRRHAAASGGSRSGGSSGGSSSTGSGGGSVPSAPSTQNSDPVGSTTDKVKKTTGDATGSAGGATSSLTEATNYCQSALSGAGLATNSTNMSKCVDAYQSGGKAAVASLIQTLKAAAGLL